MYKIKQIPEDFFVREIINLKSEKGKYSYYLLKKKNLTTSKAIEIICRKFNLNNNDIGYCGNKDKDAVTEQYISILGNKNYSFHERNLELKFINYGDKKISLGDNIGNEFIITIRNLNKKYEKIDFIVNYFDDQRFSKNNVLIGKYLLQRKFKEICEILNLDSKNPLNSLNNLNKKELRFYLHSYQSYIFNKAVSEYLSRNKCKKIKYSLGKLNYVNKFKDIRFPLISFDAKFKDKIYLRILKNEGIKLNDFLIKQIPWLIEETSYRDIFVKVKNFKILNYEKDELNEGKFKETISFDLQKGSYATMLIKQMFL